MVKGVLLSLCLSTIGVIATSSEVEGEAISREHLSATACLAEQFYKIAQEKLESGQFKAAIHAFEQAIFFNPNLSEVKLRQEKLRKDLAAQAATAYREGLQHYQLLRFEEAKQSWQTALHAIVDDEDPLKLKIQKVLLSPSFVRRGQGEVDLPRHNSVAAVCLGPLDQVCPPLLPTRGREQNIRTLLEAGDQAQAMLALKEVLQKSPDNERAGKVYSNLETSLKKEGIPGPSQEIEEKFAQAKKLLDASQNPSQLKAYHQLKRAHSLFKGDDLRPPFFKQIEEELKKNTDTLTKELEAKLLQYNVILSGAKNPDFTRIGESLRHAIQNYPPSEKAAALLQKIYDRLDEKARPLLMASRTEQEMEGCSVALEDFEAVKKTAVFPEVLAWSEAHKNLEACKK